MDNGFSEANRAPGGAHGGSKKFGHVAVLSKTAIEFLAVRYGGTYIDATLGLGGHSWEIAKRLGAQGRLIGFDKDAVALQRARERLKNPPAELAGDWPQVVRWCESAAPEQWLWRFSATSFPHRIRKSHRQAHARRSDLPLVRRSALTAGPSSCPTGLPPEN